METTQTANPTPASSAAQTSPLAGIDPKQVQVIESSVVDGAKAFVLPATAAQVKSVQVIDLDMLLVLDDGTAWLLKEGGFLATTGGAQQLKFSDGNGISLSDMLSRVGVMTPSDTASFRLSTAEFKHSDAQPPGGQGLNLGKGDDDSQTGPATEEIQMVMQSLQNAHLSDNPVAEQVVTPIKVGDYEAPPEIPVPATPTGTPQTETKTEDFTQENTNQEVSNGTAIKPATLTGFETLKLAGVDQAAGEISVTELGLGQMTVSPLLVSVSQGATAVQSNWSSNEDGHAQAWASLNLGPPSNAAKVLVEMVRLPDIDTGFSLNGHPLLELGASQTFDYVATDGPLTIPVSWSLIEQDIASTDFVLKVQYLDAQGNPLYFTDASGVTLAYNQVITLRYESVEHADQFLQLDANGNAILVLPSNGLSYGITGRESADAIDAGFGNDSVAGLAGNDSLNGGEGHDTLDGGEGHDLLFGQQGDDRLLGSGGDDSLDGGDGSDSLFGGEGADQLNGGQGDDWLVGGSGADTIDGGEGSDTLSYSDASGSVDVALGGQSLGADAAGDWVTNVENLIGSAFNDQLRGDAQDNILMGGAGNDTLEGGSGADTLVGGASLQGDDLAAGEVNTASYAHSSDGLVVSLLEPAINAGDAAGDVLIGISDLWGGSGSDVLSGDGQNNQLLGGEGDDSLMGLQGNDVLLGDTGDDVLQGGLGNDRLEGGDGLDLLQGDAGDDSLDGGDGNDVLQGGLGNDLLQGDAGDDQLKGGTGDDSLIGGVGSDSLAGEAGNDSLMGGEGDDVLNGGEGADALDGGDGQDTAAYADALSGVAVNLLDATLNGGDEAQGDTYVNIEGVLGSSWGDSLTGDASANRLSGASGNDTLEGGAGYDTLDGGEGQDVASYATAKSAVLASLYQPASNTGDAQGDTYVSIEDLLGSNGNDTLEGSVQANVLMGGKGDDLLIGRGGGDQFDGGDGVDTASYSQAANGVVIYLDPEAQGLNGGAAVGDYFSQVENIIGTPYADVIYGDDAANRLSGGAGDDVLDGGQGTAGDVLDGGDGIDTVTYAQAQSGVDMSLESGGTTGDAMGDSYIGIENVEGSMFDDSIGGDTGNNVLAGGAGNDQLSGGGGAGGDVFYGGEGDDLMRQTGNGRNTYYGGSAELDAGTDTVSYETLKTALRVSLTGGGTNGAGSSETYFGIENITGGGGNDWIEGDAVANQLRGGDGADTLMGGEGNDALFGGAGNDLMVGGEGADLFNGGDGVDTVSYIAQTSDLLIDLVGPASTGVATGDQYDSIEVVIGGQGNDHFIASNQAMRFDGGGSSSGDMVDYSYAVVSADGAGVGVNLGDAVAATGSWALGDTFVGIEHVVGSAGNDVIAGSAAANALNGGDGNDSLIGAAGTDSLSGGDGDDSLDGGTGNDSLMGGAGNDQLSGGDGNDVLRAEAGDDWLSGGLGNDTLDGGSGRDTVSYAERMESVVVDLIRGQAQIGSERDVLVDIQDLQGGSGDDQLIGDEHDNGLAGQAGDDTLSGGAGSDSLSGGEGDDVLIGGAGADVLDGGADGVDAIDAGMDLVSYADADQGVTASLSAANGVIATGDAAGDTYVRIDGLIGSANDDQLYGFDAQASYLEGGAGNDRLQAYESDDTLIGGAGADSLFGGGGSDVLEGGDGDDWFAGGHDTAAADSFTGGDGYDVVSYAALDVGVWLNLTDQALADYRGDTFSGIEHIDGTANKDVFLDYATDTTELNGGSDLYTDPADRALFNTISFASESAGVSATLASNRLLNFQHLIGGSGDDTLSGHEGRIDWLQGGLGDDTLLATGGDDTLDGGEGADVADLSVLSSVGLQVVYSNSAEAKVIGDGLQVSLVDIEQLWGSMGDDSMTGAEGNEIFVGAQGNDRLDGGGGADVLLGGEGDDTLLGGSGDDTLVGGAGADVFDGGDGLDVVSYADASGAVYITLAVPNSQAGDANGDQYSNIEAVVGSNFNDTVYGSSAADHVSGGGGNDLFYGSAGADTLDGGVGSNQVNYSGSAVAIQVDLSSAAAQAGGDAQGDQLSHIQEIIGSAFSDALTGDDTANKLFGQDGNDSITGGAGNDVLSGDEGNDQLSGGDGNDYLTAGAGADQLLGGSGDDILDARTGNGDATLANDVLRGEGGNDVFMVDYGKLDASTQIDGGSGLDVVQLHMAGNGSLALKDLNGNLFTSIEAIDFSKDGVATNLTIDAGSIGTLVDAANPSLTLVLKQGSDLVSFNGSPAITGPNTYYFASTQETIVVQFV